ncbi:MAG TPA: hypothetical protein VGE47_17540, partial [Burkholderiaceae bacterium]
RVGGFGGAKRSAKRLLPALGAAVSTTADAAAAFDVFAAADLVAAGLGAAAVGVLGAVVLLK